MRKILLASAVLTIFSLSIILFQVSCSKRVDAQQTPATTTTLDKTLLQKTVQAQNGTATDSSGNVAPAYVYASEYYTINNDGTNLTKINIPLAAGTFLRAGVSSGYLSPDGKKLVFVASTGGAQSSIYAFTLATGDLVKLIDNANADDSYQLLNTY